uniref:Replicative DNA helicase n=1 Tax=uncultured Prevotella sp. TaxID=159272 RepID=A0A6G8F1M9_9BACT|nr:replicative DNA helicase [uncultured Prevotella sp.]
MANTSNTTRKRKPQQAIDTTLGHLPPQAVDVEKVVLGALMIDADAFSIVSEILAPETFYEPRHQKIYRAIQALNMKEQPVDMVTVCEELKHEGTHDEVGAPTYIIDLTQSVASSANVEYHSHILAQKYMARQLISYASNVETKAFDEAQDVDELMQEAEGSLFELSQRNMRQDYTQIDPVVVQARDLILKAANNTGGITGVPTGYTEFDKVTSGWQPSDLIIIAGRPAMGKTSFALSLAKNIAIDNHDPVAFFSLEMNNVQLVNRLISNVCSVPGSKILNGQLTQDEWSRFDNHIGKLMGAPLYVDDTPGLSVFELRTKARRLVREKGVKVIMIDYLQLMNANGMKFNSRQEEVSTISRSLKGLAKELDIPIIALSQLSRAVEQRPGEEGKRPQLSDLRESGAIEQDADMVIFVHRPEYYRIFEDAQGNSLKGMALICIAKHRKGATKDVTLSFKGEYTRFANPDEHDPYDTSQDGGSFRSSGLNQSFSSDDDPLLNGGTISNDVPY